MTDPPDPLALARTAQAIGRPLEKLIETVASGIGALARPWMIRRMAQAEVDAARIRLTGQRELLALQAKQAEASETTAIIDAEYEVNSGEPLPLVTRARDRFEYQEAKRQTNIEGVISEAAEELKKVKDVADAPVSDDFTARFFGHAQDVSDEEMRRIWGRILAGEVAQPGQFSLRCLDVLRNVTKHEAKLFEGVMPFVFDSGSGILRPRSFNDEVAYGPAHPLRFSAIHALSDAGLLTGHELLQWNLSPSDDATDFFIRFTGYAIHIKRALRNAFNQPTKGPLTTEGVALSLAGRQLAALYSSVDTDRAALEQQIDWWEGRNGSSPMIQIEGTLHRMVGDEIDAEVLYPAARAAPTPPASSPDPRSAPESPAPSSAPHAPTTAPKGS